MISITSAQLDAWLVAFIWPFTRILGLIAVAPVTGGPQFPARAKVAFALLVTLVVSPASDVFTLTWCAFIPPNNTGSFSVEVLKGNLKIHHLPE